MVALHIVPQHGTNIISATHFRDMFDLLKKVKAVVAANGKGLTDVCEKDTLGRCRVSSVLNYFGFGAPNVTLFDKQVGNNTAALQNILVGNVYPGTNVPAEKDFTLTNHVQIGNTITATSAFITLNIRGKYSGDGDCLLSTCDQKQWEDAMLDAMGGRGPAGPLLYKSLTVFRVSNQSMDDELARNVSEEIFLFVLTFNFMVAFCCLVLGRYRRGKEGGITSSCIMQRWSLGVAGCGLVFVSMGVGYGVASAAGAKFTTLQMILPFVLLGVGVDDMLIITLAFDSAKLKTPEASIPDLCSKSLREVAISITLTSVTATTAFLLGSTSSLPAITYFCYYAASSIMIDYIFMVTSFVALLALDERRQRSQKYDCLCCFGEDAQQEGSAPPATSPVPLVSGSLIPSNSEVGHPSHAEILKVPVEETDESEQTETPLQHFLRHSFVPCILHSTTTKTGILTLFLAFSGVCIWAYHNATIGFNLMDLTPDKSYVRDYFECLKRITGTTQIRTETTLVFAYNDFHLASTQNAMALTLNAWAANQYIYIVKSWLPIFYSYTNTSQPQYMVNGVFVPGSDTTFGSTMKQFLNYTCPVGVATCTPGTKPNVHFANMVSFRPGENIVQGIRIRALHSVLTSSVEEGECFESMDSFVRNQVDLNPKPFVYAIPYIFWHQFTVIERELFQTLILAMFAVAALCGILLRSLRGTFAVLLSLVLVDIDLLGSLYFWGLEVNSITTINLVMSIGLVVDYTLHLVNSINMQPEALEMDVRITNALVEIGPAVLLGATTTFIGTVPLGFAKSEVFRVFFRAMLGVIVFGTVHGFIFTPVVMSLLGANESEPNVTPCIDTGKRHDAAPGGISDVALTSLDNAEHGATVHAVKD